jgi:hypothetical protein
MVKKYYSMTINIPRDHTKPSTFVFGRWLGIKTLDRFDQVIENMKKATTKDSKGRILCYGHIVQYNMTEQKRMFVVKMGHDGKLWFDMTPLGQIIRHRLPRERLS